MYRTWQLQLMVYIIFIYQYRNIANCMCTCKATGLRIWLDYPNHIQNMLAPPLIIHINYCYTHCYKYYPIV